MNVQWRDPAHDFASLLPRLDMDGARLPKRVSASQALGLHLPVVAINLRHRTDRWSALTQRMASVGLTDIVQAPAVEGAALSAADIGRFLGSDAPYRDTTPDTHLTLTRPAVGCFLSHLAVWQWVVEQDIPRVLVLEDDARPGPGFDPVLFRETVTALPDSAGLVFPGCLIMAGLAEPATEAQSLGRLYYFNGTFSYLITPAACRFLLSRMVPLAAHIDHQLSALLVAYRDVFPAYHLAPPFFEPDWSLRSDCYVPLADEPAADRALGAIFAEHRAELAAEGRPLLPLHT